MTTQQQTERDETPIDEKRILADILEAITKLGTVGPWHDDLLRAAALLRGDEPAKPDRYVVADEKALITEAIKRSRGDGIDRTKNQAVSYACSTLLSLIKEGWKPEAKPMDTSFVGNCSPTHRCKVCGALWICRSDSWSLCSKECGPCCDNEPMAEQIEELILSDCITWKTPPSPKSDRYEEVAKEFILSWYPCLDPTSYEKMGGFSSPTFQAAAAVLRRHFEPSAEVVEAARIVKSWNSKPPHSDILADFILKGDQ